VPLAGGSALAVLAVQDAILLGNSQHFR
jgi:hypothetical protein